MANSEGIEDIVNQVAIQAAMAVMMAFRDMDTGSQPATISNTKSEAQREKTRKDKRYVELLNFKLEVTNILEKRAYEISDEKNVLVIMNWLGREGRLLAAKNICTRTKRET